MKRLTRSICALILTTVAAGCGGANMAVEPRPTKPPEVAAPAILKQSHYSRDARGTLTEAALQKVLSLPIDLQFPARVGVVPLGKPFDPKAKVSIQVRSSAARHLAEALLGSPQFSHVSDISTDLPNEGSLEGLRVLAARYRMRYLLLYSETFVDDTHLNGWAWLYPTGLGMFIAPGVTVESNGLAQVHLLDVRTGTILFTLAEPMKVSSAQLMVGAGRKHREKQVLAATRAADRLAKRTSAAANMLVAFAEEYGRGEKRVRTRILPAPIADTGPIVPKEPLAP